MNDIYNILAKLLPKYENIAGLYTKDKNEIDEKYVFNKNINPHN